MGCHRTVILIQISILLNIPMLFLHSTHTTYRYSCFWKCCCLEYNRSPYSRLGITLIITRMITLYVSAYFVLLQCMLYSVETGFKIVILVCDVYLIFYWYLTLNTPVYINGVNVSDRRLIIADRMKTRMFWDVMTLFPFEVKALMIFFIGC